MSKLQRKAPSGKHEPAVDLSAGPGAARAPACPVASFAAEYRRLAAVFDAHPDQHGSPSLEALTERMDAIAIAATAFPSVGISGALFQIAVATSYLDQLGEADSVALPAPYRTLLNAAVRGLWFAADGIETGSRIDRETVGAGRLIPKYAAFHVTGEVPATPT